MLGGGDVPGGSSGGGGGGSVYWGRKGSDFKGIVVMFAWVSIDEKHLKSFVDLYSFFGWNSLVSHANFFTAFGTEKVLSLSFVLLNELVQELRSRPCPVVLISLSGGAEAGMYKVLQIIQGTCEGHLNLDDTYLVRNCLSGHIYDSGPTEFTADLGARFALHPALRKMIPSNVMSWVAKGVASGLDGLYLTRFEYQRAEYWQALSRSVDLGAPYLILCSQNDDVAPFNVICKFARCLQDLGADVKLVSWKGSSHIGHYKNHPVQYRAAIATLLEKATSVYSQRIQQLVQGIGMESMHDEISDIICNLQKAVDNSNQSVERVVVGRHGHSSVSTSADYQNREFEPSQDERKEKSVCLPSPPSISANSVLGKIFFDVCVPKNVEGWDIRFSSSMNGKPIGSASRNFPFPGVKCFRRSRL